MMKTEHMKALEKYITRTRRFRMENFETVSLPHPVCFPNSSSTLIITETFREQFHFDDDAGAGSEEQRAFL
jgi:hypothetical protein